MSNEAGGVQLDLRHCVIIYSLLHSLITYFSEPSAQKNFVRPGTATSGTPSFMSHVSGSFGASDSSDLIASSHVTVLPVYAAMRPMMPTIVECAIFSEKLS